MNAKALLYTIPILIIGCYSTHLSRPPEFYFTTINNNSSNSKIIYQDGVEFLVSHLQNSSIVISAKKTTNNIIIFKLSLKNSSNKIINFIPEKISVIAYDNIKGNKSLRILSINECMIIYDRENPSISSYSVGDPWFIITYKNELLALAQKQAEDRDAFNKQLLKRKTLGPFEEISGYLYVKYKYADVYKVKIPLSDETHIIEMVPE